MQTVTTYPTERVLRLVLERAKGRKHTTTRKGQEEQPEKNERDTGAAKDARAERRPNEEGSHFEIKHQVNVGNINIISRLKVLQRNRRR